jgi:3-hydroxybutyryl-CoA dehydrogenase
MMAELLTSVTIYQGLGIALVAAQKAQVPVTLVDSSQASLDKGLAFAGW